MSSTDTVLDILRVNCHGAEELEQFCFENGLSSVHSDVVKRRIELYLDNIQDYSTVYENLENHFKSLEELNEAIKLGLDPNHETVKKLRFKLQVC